MTNNVYAFRPDEEEVSVPESAYPAYEGRPVEALRIRLKSVAGLPFDEGHHPLDQLVRFTVECRVTGVNHQVNQHGKLERSETFKVLEITETPWDEV